MWTPDPDQPGYEKLTMEGARKISDESIKRGEREKNKQVRSIDLHLPKSEALALMLAVDIATKHTENENDQKSVKNWENVAWKARMKIIDKFPNPKKEQDAYYNKIFGDYK